MWESRPSSAVLTERSTVPTPIRAQVSWQAGSGLPRDRIQITPCFMHHDVLLNNDPGWQDLADDLVDAVETWAAVGTGQEVMVRLYKIQAPVPGEPHRPEAIAIRNAGAIGEATQVREVALCLSFWGGTNGPRQRGRLYLPAYLVQGTAQLQVRPTSANRTKAGGMATVLANLGGLNVDWVVWSKVNGSATTVSNWFVDDEWDTQRSRGLRPSARTSGTVDE